MGFLPSQNGGIDYQRFNADSFVNATDYLDWRMPRGAKYVYMLVGGPGQSGSSGFAATTGAAGSGGGGGTGAVARGIIPAFLLPKHLLVQVGKGAVATTAAGAAGNLPVRGTSIGYTTNGSAGYQFMLTTTNGTAAGAATAAAGGTGGSNQSTSSQMFSLPFATISNGGAAGNITGAGTTTLVNVLTSQAGSSGAGCASTYAAANGGGAVFTSAVDGRIYSGAGGTGAAAGGTDGADGVTIWYNDGLMFQSSAGAGGGNASTGKAGNGGKGGLCSGGGGGGAASGAGGTAGFGGAGGDGIVIIACW